MPGDKIKFTKEKETMLMTLSGRALQSQWKDPILHDPWAEEAMRHIDYDLSKQLTGVASWSMWKDIGPTIIATRAATFDLLTTRYLTDNYADVEFRVIGQAEKDGKISRTSEFVMDGKVIVHSVVEIDIASNPEKFVEIMREQTTPIGDALRDNGYHVERDILRHDASSKIYAMKGDVNLKITEKYYNM